MPNNPTSQSVSPLRITLLYLLVVQFLSIVPTEQSSSAHLLYSYHSYIFIPLAGIAPLECELTLSLCLDILFFIQAPPVSK